MPKRLINEKRSKTVSEESRRLLQERIFPANDVVTAITAIILFAVVRWKSGSRFFFCFELTRHPDEKRKLQEHSVKVTTPLVQQIVAQSHQMPDDSLVKPLQQAVRSERAKALQDRAVHIREVAPQKVQRALDLAAEKGSSVWLTVLPLREMGFNLNKREFRDAIKLRYDWPVDDISSTCVCGDIFPVDHAMICKRGGFITQRHNELRDLEADLLSMVCSDVEIEPVLQDISGE